MKKNKLLRLIIAVLILGGFIYQNIAPLFKTNTPTTPDIKTIVEDGYYTSKEDVALYIDVYDELPDNYITKDEARKLGWIANEGNLWEVTDMKSIGGDIFQNYEGNLPEEDGRIWYECDIDYEGGYRNAKRILFSNDGLIYYTDDHYETFEVIIGE